MKITEIISETPIQEAFIDKLLARAIKGAGKGTSKAGGAADDAARAAKTTPDNTPRMSHADRVRAANAEKDAAKARRAAGRADAAFLTRHYSNEAIQLINFFGLANAAYDYYTGWKELQAKYPNGGEEYDREYRNLLGLTIAQWIAPKVVLKLANLPGIKQAVNLVPGLVGLLKMPNAAEIIRAVSSATGRAALVYYFQTEQGKSTLTNMLGGLVVGTLGNAAVIAGNLLTVIAGYAGDVATGNKTVDDVVQDIKDKVSGSDDASDKTDSSGGNADVAGTSSAPGSRARDNSSGKAPTDYDPNKLNSWDFSIKDIKR